MHQAVSLPTTKDMETDMSDDTTRRLYAERELRRLTDYILTATDSKLERTCSHQDLVAGMHAGRGIIGLSKVALHVFGETKYPTIFEGTDLTLDTARQYLNAYAATLPDGSRDFADACTSATKLIAGQLNFDDYTRVVFLVVFGIVISQRYSPEPADTNVS